MSQSEPDWQAVEDTDNLNQKMQIRGINQARSKVRDVRNRAQEQIASANVSQRSRVARGGRTIYLQVVKSYALEFSPLIQTHDDDLWSKEKLLESKWFHSPPDSDKQVVDIDPEGRQVQITGLVEFLATEFPIKSSYTVTFEDSASGETADEFTSTWTPSFAEIDSILFRLDRSRTRLGLYLEGPNEIDMEYTHHDNDAF